MPLIWSPVRHPDRREIDDAAAARREILRVIGGVDHHAHEIVLEQDVPCGGHRLGPRQALCGPRTPELADAQRPGRRRCRRTGSLGKRSAGTQTPSSPPTQPLRRQPAPSQSARVSDMAVTAVARAATVRLIEPDTTSKTSVDTLSASGLLTRARGLAAAARLSRRRTGAGPSPRLRRGEAPRRRWWGRLLGRRLEPRRLVAPAPERRSAPAGG